MPGLLYNQQSSLLEWLASCLVCFTLNKAPLQSGQFHATSDLQLPKITFRLVSFMLRLLYIYQSSTLDWSSSCFFCFIINKAPIQAGVLHATSALPLTQLPFRVVSFMPRLLYNYLCSPLQWSASCLVCFIITKATLQSGQLHDSSAYIITKAPLRVVNFMPRLLYI